MAGWEQTERMAALHRNDFLHYVTIPQPLDSQHEISSCVGFESVPNWWTSAGR